MLSVGLDTLKERGRQLAGDLASRVLSLASSTLERTAQMQVSERGPFPRVDSADMRWGAGQDRARMLVLRDVTEAVQLDRMRQEFVAKAWHGLTTPITAVSAAVEALELGALLVGHARQAFHGAAHAAQEDAVVLRLVSA